MSKAFCVLLFILPEFLLSIFFTVRFIMNANFYKAETLQTLHQVLVVIKSFHHAVSSLVLSNINLFFISNTDLRNTSPSVVKKPSALLLLVF